jgi:signal transduction histidine kinase/DNA-binding NarL/FixJ family response regulator
MGLMPAAPPIRTAAEHPIRPDHAVRLLALGFEALEAGVALFDADGRCLVRNARLSDVLDLPEALDGPGATLRAILQHRLARGDRGPPLPDETGSEADVDAALAAFATGPGPVAWTARDGRVLDLSIRRGAEGTLAVWRDVTAVRRNEALLEDQRARVAHFLLNTTDAVVLMDEDGTILESSAHGGELLGLPPDMPVRGMTHSDVLRFLYRRGDYGFGVPEDEFVAKRRAAILAAGRLTFTAPMPGDRWVEYSFRPLPEGRLMIVVRDVTELKGAATALEAERNLLRGVLEGMHDALIVLSPDGVITQTNDRAAALMGVPAELVAQGQHYTAAQRWLFDRGAYGFEQSFEDIVAGRWALGTSPGGMREIRRSEDGRWIEYSYRPLPDGRILGVLRDVSELKDATAAVEADRNLLRGVLDGLQDAILVLTPDGTISQANERAAALMGVPPHLIRPGLHYAEALRWQYDRGAYGHGQSFAEFVADHWLRNIAAGGSRHVRRLEDGRWVEHGFRSLPDGRLLGVLRDVTEAREAANAVETERNLLRRVLDGMQDAALLMDRAGTIIETNGRAAGLLGVPDAVVGRGAHYTELLRHLHELGVYGTDRPLEEVVAERWTLLTAPEGLRQIRRFPNGRWLEYDFRPLPDDRRLVTVKDVTELMEAANAVEAERNLLRRVLDGMQDAVVLMDRDGTILETNDRAAELMEVPAALVARGARHEGVLHWRHARGEFGFAQAAEEIAAARRAEVTRPGGYRQLRRAASGRWLDYAFVPMPEEQLLVVCRDVTAAKANEEAALAAKAEAEAARDAAEAAAQAKATFLASMSHEIRTPMNGVLGMMEVLERSGLSPEQARGVAVMRGSAQSLLRILDDILDFSKIDAGRLEVEALPFSLRDLVDGALDTLSPGAVAKGLAIFADPRGPGPDRVTGDATRVRQILFNLLSNAIKFTERGFVRLNAETREEAGGVVVTLTVEDSGIGMDTPTLARLFRPFAQADSSTTRRFGGTGLGLSIVRRLAQLMDGDVVVESKPRRGSRFIVTLRLLPAAPVLVEPVPAAVPAAPRIATPGTARLLVADDHPVNREVIERQLELLGLRADLAEDGAAALEAWRAARHPVVLLDVHMPRMDGLDVARAIRREEAAGMADAGARTALVAVTANAMKGEDERCFAAGMDGFLAKPVALDALARTLGRWVPGLAPGSSSGPAEVAGALYDPQALVGLFGSDRARLRGIIEAFAESAEQEVAALLRRPAAPEAAHVAHRLKGAARMVGARLLAEQAAEVEAAGRKGDGDAAAAASACLADLLTRTLRAARAGGGLRGGA